MRLKYYIIIIAFFTCFTSCEQVLFEDKIETNDPFVNFEYLWNECNEKYSYFDLKDVNWEDVKNKYSGKIYNGMSEDSLFNVLGGMLKELKDDHANLISNFKTSFYGVEYQSQDNFDWRIIIDNYFDSQFNITGPFTHNFIENQQMGYIRLSSFVNEIEPSHLDYILDKYKDTKGLVFDVRENGGGAIINVYAILSRFINDQTLVYYSRIKSGKGINDFSEAKKVYIQPYYGKRYTKDIVLITDRGTYSSGSLITLASKAIPHITIIGDTTGGGLGMPNGGQLPNGWRYRFSITQTLTLDKKTDYENGVPPDISVNFDWNDLKKDEILDRAIEELQ
ncbi:MAG: S41 family peptidase [Candidatus Kapaibacteriales bacterium]